MYVKVPIEQCWQRTGKGPIGTKWLDVYKGDKVNPDIRSRWVAQEIRVDKREDLFAATPPLEGKKLLFILAVTKGYGYVDNREHGMKSDFIDVRRAFFTL